jgi:hypothetical protein
LLDCKKTGNWTELIIGCNRSAVAVALLWDLVAVRLPQFWENKKLVKNWLQLVATAIFDGKFIVVGVSVGDYVYVTVYISIRWSGGSYVMITSKVIIFGKQITLIGNIPTIEKI